MFTHQSIMRTTLDLDNDVLQAAKELARRQKLSTGQVVSRLLRQAMVGAGAQAPTTQPEAGVAGFRPFSSATHQLVSNNQVEAIRDQEGI